MAGDNFIPVNAPVLDGNEQRYLNECITTGWISSEGPFVSRFEEQFAARVDRRHGIAVTNGTAALDVAIEALGIGAGDEVILPTFTIISCVHQIVRSGATPVLVDADPLTWNMNVDEIAERITPRTRAIMAVHIYGLPVDMAPILGLAETHGLAIIEDAAEAIGQTYRNRPCGSFGDLSTFSFYPNKHVTTGEGGMLTTNDGGLAADCRSLRNLCFQSQRRFVHERLGWNLRMTNLQAALGVAQLERLTQTVNRKREIGRIYDRLLADVDGLQRPLPRTAYAENIYWVFGVVLQRAPKLTAEVVMNALAAEGIGTRPFFHPLHQQPVLRDRGLFEGAHHPVAERLSRFGFYLPSGLSLTDEQVGQAAEALKKVHQ